MSLFVSGMPCRICGKPISNEDQKIQFSPFITNEADPLFFFNDGTFHRTCFDNHSLASKVLMIRELAKPNASVANRISFISGKQLSDPNNCLSLGYLTTDPNDPLSEFNFAHFSKLELVSWDRLNELICMLSDARDQGRLRGRGINWLIEQLRSQRRNPFTNSNTLMS